MKIEDIMIHKVTIIEPNATAREAARLMNKHEIRCLIVVKQNARVMIIMTKRDAQKSG